MFRLWRAVDQDGNVPEKILQSTRDSQAATRGLKSLVKRFGRPKRIVTDTLRS
jgi:putative transposase